MQIIRGLLLYFTTVLYYCTLLQVIRGDVRVYVCRSLEVVKLLLSLGAKVRKYYCTLLLYFTTVLYYR